MAYEDARYLEVAQLACELERGKQWKEASKHWLQATKYATIRNNATWSEGRAQYCAVRAGIRFTPLLHKEPT